MPLINKNFAIEIFSRLEEPCSSFGKHSFPIKLDDFEMISINILKSIELKIMEFFYPVWFCFVVFCFVFLIFLLFYDSILEIIPSTKFNSLQL